MKANIKNLVLGKSTSGLPICAHQFPPLEPTSHHVLIIGGVHGDEVEGIQGALGLYEFYLNHPPKNFKLTLVPIFNVDGALAKTRQNKNSVDLNRNLPTKDWTPEVLKPRYNPGPSANSELENQSLVRFIEEEKPTLIYSLHSWNPMLNINGDCRAQAEVIHKITGYSIEESIGYPTPGCLGTYTGLERNIPTLTYEIERGLACEKILEIHVPAIVESLKTLK